MNKFLMRLSYMLPDLLARAAAGDATAIATLALAGIVVAVSAVKKNT